MFEAHPFINLSLGNRGKRFRFHNERPEKRLGPRGTPY